MAISFINGVTVAAGSTSITATSALVGDFLLLMQATNSTGIPTLQTGMNNFTNNTQASAGGGSDCAVRVSYKFCTSPDEVVPCSGGLGSSLCIYRGVDTSAPIQAGSAATGNSANPAYPARTYSPDAWNMAWCAARDSTPQDLTFPGTLTRRTTQQTASTGQISQADSAATVASFTAANGGGGAGKYVCGTFGLTPASEARTATLTRTLADATGASVSAVALAGATTKTLDNATVAGVGKAALVSTTARTLESATIVAAGLTQIQGYTTKTLDATLLSSASVLALAASVTKTLGAATSSVAGALASLASINVTLAPATSVSAGALASLGGLTRTLDDATGASAGTSPLVAATTRTLESTTLSSTGLLPIVATAAPTLALVVSEAAAALDNTGATVRTLADVTSAAAAGLGIAGSTARTLADATLVSSGEIFTGVSGGLDTTLEPVTSVVAATTAIAGTLAQTLAGATIAAASIAQIAGTTIRTLEAATGAGTAFVTSGPGGTLVRTLAAASVLGRATLPAVGVLARTLSPAVSASAGSITLSGSTVRALADTSVVAQGSQFVPPIFGEVIKPLLPTTSAAVGVLSHVGSVVHTLADVQVLAHLKAKIAETAFDYPNRSSGHPTYWSKPQLAPFLPPLVVALDPRAIRLYDTVSCLLVFDGVPYVAGHQVGLGENIVTTLVILAQQLDGFSPNLHAFSEAHQLGVQAMAGHAITELKLLATPLTTEQVPQPVYFDHPGDPGPGDTRLRIELVRDGHPVAYEVDRLGSEEDDLLAMAQRLNKTIYLDAVVAPDSFVVATHAGHTLAAGTLEYV